MGVVVVTAVGLLAGVALAAAIVRHRRRRRRQPLREKAERVMADVDSAGVRWERILIRMAQAAGTAAGTGLAKRLFSRSGA
jgi:hypothetical protein